VFDTKEWLAAHIVNAAALTPETWATLSGFTVLWNLFEERLCQPQADIPAFERLARQFGGDPLTHQMTAAYEFWLNRYIEQGTTNLRFDELFVRPNGKPRTAATLCDPNSNSNERFLGLLTVTYRLRNNLFHGGKRIETLNDQRGNLETASRLLATVMEHFGVA
jgi:hypothetical protein